MSTPIHTLSTSWHITTLFGGWQAACRLDCYKIMLQYTIYCLFYLRILLYFIEVGRMLVLSPSTYITSLQLLSSRVNMSVFHHISPTPPGANTSLAGPLPLQCPYFPHTFHQMTYCQIHNFPLLKSNSEIQHPHTHTLLSP
jgi:hypothetical protein